MKVNSSSGWCGSGNCPCPVREYVKRQSFCFSFEKIMQEMIENEAMIIKCLYNLLEQDVVCKDGDLWCPDNPY